MMRRYQLASTLNIHVARICLGLVLVACLLLVHPQDARAQSCVEWAVAGERSSVKKYRVNANSFDLLAAITRDQGQKAWAIAANTWNEQADAGLYLYESSTSALDIPANLADCISMGVDYSIVKVRDACSDSFGQVEPRCKDSQGIAHQYTISINARDSLNSCRPFAWATGTVGPTQFDVLWTMIHEFGHPLGLLHPGSGAYSVMSPGEKGISRFRDLYWWDQKCTRELSGRRTLDAARRNIKTFDPEIVFATGISQISVGIAQILVIGYWWWPWVVMNTQNCTAMQTGFNTLTPKCPIPGWWGIAPRAGLWRESPRVKRIFAVDPGEQPEYEWFSKHQLRTVFSSDEFNQTTSLPMRYCSSMTGPLTCTSNEAVAVNTGRPVSIAFENYNNRSVTTWVDQTRTDDTQDRQIRIAVGQVADDLLPTPDVWPGQTLATPGVACNAFSAGGWDCIIAYVDETDVDRKISVKRFYTFWSTVDNRYRLAKDSSTFTIPYWATSSLTAWYRSDTDLFYVGFKAHLSGEFFLVFKSDNGDTWSFDWFQFGPVLPITGVSYWEDSNSWITYGKNP